MEILVALGRATSPSDTSPGEADEEVAGEEDACDVGEEDVDDQLWMAPELPQDETGGRTKEGGQHQRPACTWAAAVSRPVGRPLPRLNPFRPPIGTSTAQLLRRKA